MKTIVKYFKYPTFNPSYGKEIINDKSYDIVERDINTYLKNHNLDIVSINPDPFGAVWVIFKTKE